MEYEGPSWLNHNKQTGHARARSWQLRRDSCSIFKNFGSQLFSHCNWPRWEYLYHRNQYYKSGLSTFPPENQLSVTSQVLVVSIEKVLLEVCPYFWSLKQRIGGFAAGWFLSSTYVIEIISSIRFDRTREAGNLNQSHSNKLLKGIYHSKDSHVL